MEILEDFLAFLTSPIFATAAKIFILGIFTLHFSLAIWVARDVSRRTLNFPLQILAVFVAIFVPIFGILFYLILRPEQIFHEKVLENFLRRENFCAACGAPHEKDFEFCPFCGEKSLEKCHKCKKPIFTFFDFCPFCGVENSPKK